VVEWKKAIGRDPIGSKRNHSTVFYRHL
jgi:hypothetical protein